MLVKFSIVIGIVLILAWPYIKSMINWPNLLFYSAIVLFFIAIIRMERPR